MSPDNLYIIVTSVFVIVIGIDIYNWMKDRTIVAPEIKLKRFRSKITGTALMLGLTMLIASILFHVNIFQYASPVSFDEIDRVTLKDFKGYRRPFQTLDGVKEFAFITTTLEWRRSQTSVEVEALFHPARSYVYNGRVIDRLLLNHELYHFRITELFARRCRQELSEKKDIPSERVIEEIVTLARQSEMQMQFRYDDESYHGYLLKEQKRWEKKIDSLLNLLDEYKTRSVHYE